VRHFKCVLFIVCALSVIGFSIFDEAGGQSSGEALTAAAAAAKTGEVLTRPSHWARPISGKRGLPNLFQVDEAVYRGAQPEKEGFAELKAMGVKTVINLRTFHSDKKECEEAGLRMISITTQAWEGEEEEAAAFLRAVTDPENQPVFFHCQHGADRTGTMCAVYRIAVQGWTKDEAIREMTEGGFGFHSVWQNLVAFIRGLNVASVSEKAGIQKPAGSGGT
jgi:protein tyrosine/serine phosphatase